ncbi:biosynthetic arginine decarboxylase [candidate division KSB1 bacterium]|nr:biosynthetic arginine decarboxylase [candidate division KSB1 bacterium]
MWSIQDSLELYNVKNWGNGFFDINEKGHVSVLPTRDPNESIDLKILIDELQSRGIQLPILLRFSDVLYERMREICSAFSQAITEFEYKGEYQGVYPVKVNQVKQVVESIVDSGKDYKYGLEVGSKPELMMVLGLVTARDSIVVCNGYKDAEFIELALLGKKLGINIILVIEKFSELELTLKIARKVNVDPNIGIRIRLSSKGAGKWAESGGDRSKFGLGPVEIMRAVEMLKKEDKLNCLQLIHYHLGSQINTITTLKYGLREAGRYYAELMKMGAGLKYIDTGGGLAVDYDGSRSNRSFSSNYSMQEYANTVVYEIQSVCDENEIPHPIIVTETGRALTAYHSVLVTNVLGVAEVPRTFSPIEISDDTPTQVIEFQDVLASINQKNFREAFHDVLDLRKQILDLFNLGYLSLEWRAFAESCYWASLQKIWGFARDMEPIPVELARLEKMISDIYFCNISIFQSLPDTWAINHFFPVIPIQNHENEPVRQATLADVSCDSDGKIDLFIDEHGTRHTLPLHPIGHDNNYLLGFFLVGAYQEILGDLHNLFGDTNAVHIAWDEAEKAYLIDHVEDGDSVTDVLKYVHFNKDTLVSEFRKKVELSLRMQEIKIEEARLTLEMYRQGFEGYTYLENEQD